MAGAGSGSPSARAALALALLVLACHGGPTDAGTEAGCGPGAWCQTRLPGLDGAAFVAAWGASPREVWAVGERGAIARFDGERWRAVRAPTSRDLAAVTGLADGWAVAVGDAGTVLAWDGSAWRELATDLAGYDLCCVWAAAADRVYAAGRATGAGEPEAVIARYDGASWTLDWALEPGDAGFISGICGTDAGEVIAVGARGQGPEALYLRREADGWRRLALGNDGWPAACAGAGDHVATIDEQGFELRRLSDGAATTIDLGCDGGQCTPSFAGGRVALWAAGQRAVAVGDALVEVLGERVRRQPANGALELLAVSGRSGDGVWAVGRRGAVLHFDGRSWVRETTGVSADLRAVWAGEGLVVAAGDAATLLHRPGSP